MNTTLAVPIDGAWFEGHFPGRPILPGVAEIALIIEALAREAGSPVPIRGITFARLRHLVLPGDRLEFTTRELETGRIRIDLKRDGVLVANGELVAGTPREAQEKAAAESVASEALVPPLDDLLPHRPPMRFLTSVLRQTAEGLTATACIPNACALVSDGAAIPIAAVEAAAQAAAAWEALQRWRDAGTATPRIGYLVAMRDVVFFTDRIPADRALLVSVSLEAAAPPLTHYRFEVSLEGSPLVRGAIGTFLAV